MCGRYTLTKDPMVLQALIDYICMIPLLAGWRVGARIVFISLESAIAGAAEDLPGQRFGQQHQEGFTWMS